MTTTDSPIQHQAQDAEGLRAALGPMRPMASAPIGVAMIARHKPNAQMPNGWVATIELGNKSNEPEEFTSDSILHYNGDYLLGRFYGCWDGWWPLTALSASPPQTEPPGLDREAVALVDKLRARTISTLPADWKKGRNCPECGVEAERPKCFWEMGASCPRHDPDEYTPSPREKKPDPLCQQAADAILTATAVSQPPTTRHGAEDVEALRDALEFYADPDTYVAIAFLPDRPCGEFIWDFSDEHDPGYPKPGKRARETLAKLASVLPEQPGPVPVGDGGATREYFERYPKLAELMQEYASFGSFSDWTAFIYELNTALGSIPAVGGATGDPDKNFQLMLVRIIQRHRNGRDLTETLKGAEDLLRRKGSLSVFRETPLPAASTQTAREGGE